MLTSPIWPAGGPGTLGSGLDHEPHLTVFPAAPGRATGASVLVLPGGGYWTLADHEGSGYARWFAERGVHAAVLDYRLAKNGYRHPAMLQDAARALRVLRAEAKAAGRDPSRVAVIGSSAGGHLAAVLSTLFDHAEAADPASDAIACESARPDATILCYPVIVFADLSVPSISRDRLIGASPAAGLATLLSPDRQMRAECPPAFVWHTADDATVPVANATAFASACWSVGVSCELHVFPQGAHGLGLGSLKRPAPPWSLMLETWLVRQGWLRHDDSLRGAMIPA